MKLKLDKFAVETLNKLEDPGLLLLSANKAGKNNVMTIGWGLIGIFWRTPTFMVAVRPSRYTHDFIEESNEFTVNVPKDGMEEAVEYCGTVSGRTHDKFKECQLTLTKSKHLKTPTIKECTIHYECQVVHKLKINPTGPNKHQKRTLPQTQLPHTLLRKNPNSLQPTQINPSVSSIAPQKKIHHSIETPSQQQTHPTKISGEKKYS